eukprot:2792540-Amphidinium_carterae.1
MDYAPWFIDVFLCNKALFTVPSLLYLLSAPAENASFSLGGFEFAASLTQDKFGHHGGVHRTQLVRHSAIAFARG